MAFADHPHTDPGDGRTECEVCGKWVWECTHSCKGVPVTEAAMARLRTRAVKEAAEVGRTHEQRKRWLDGRRN